MALKQHVFEKGDKLYIVAPVSPFTPGATEVEEFAFAQELKKVAPNENLLWLKGQYVEADRPNRNGQMWTEGEVAVKSLTPMFMPVTVMHDPRTAVGLIADVALVTPDQNKVQRARIDTSLAVWAHRFPEVAEEVAHNYQAGSLMQSMECVAPHYSCGECGQMFQKLPKGAEQANWCAHLRESPTAVRILGNVVFTGTGLIFGSRGAKGAYDEAHLDVFQEEIAEFHERAHKDSRPKRKPTSRSKRKMEIEDSRYQELLSAEEKSKRLPEVESKLEEAESRASEAESKVEEIEAAKVKAEQEKAAAEQKLQQAEEQANQAKLKDERLGALGSAFKSKLGEFTRKRLDEQAATLSDEEWNSRLEELSELTGVKPDEGGDGGEGGEGGGEEFTAEEVARSQVGNGNGNGGDGGEVSTQKRASVIGGLYAESKR